MRKGFQIEVFISQEWWGKGAAHEVLSKVSSKTRFAVFALSEFWSA